MPTVEWNIPFSIITPFGTLLLNQDAGGGRRYLLNSENCTSRRAIRAASDPIAGGDGEVFHDRYANGYEMELAIQLWETDQRIACDDVLCEMRDELYGHLWSILRPQDDGGRISWSPSCEGGDRILDAVRLLALQDPEIGDKGQTEIKATIDSPFPYAISIFEDVVSLSGSTTLPNPGNVPFYPVFKVNGATSSFTITNNDTGLAYVYSGQSIPGGSYGEIDMFRGGIIYLNGDGANLKAGIDVLNSDVLYIEPGGNSFTISGASADVLTHAAYA